MRRRWGGGFGGGRIRRGVYGCIGVEATTKSLRFVGKGFGDKKCMSFSRGWVVRAIE